MNRTEDLFREGYLGLVVLCLAAAGQVRAAEAKPIIRLTAPNSVITQSCQIEIPPGNILQDTDGKGVIQVGAAHLEIEFTPGSILRGSPNGTRPDEYKGYGIRLNGFEDVTIRGAHISGFWCALWATQADGLTLEGMDASDNRRAFLKSTPEAEDESDWLFGHNNDDHEWLKTYASAIYIEASKGITVRNSRVRHGQNALCLDRVTESKIYDNDFSFNSGWGIAMWRCVRNVISRNALDFCIRGYSHGVYNRGQDSAGIFAFEQNNENTFVENSVTHGGDGFFGFAGREALGEVGTHPVEWYKRRGNNDNVLLRNDFSYAAAHGIENTFSFGNKYLENRIVGNAICGIWAGYSRDTVIGRNEFEGNGEMGYGLERGGVNIDHGGDNRILQNTFRRNKCGVHLWGGTNLDFEKKEWAKANGYASTGSLIAGNTFEADNVAFQFRGPGDARLVNNQLVNVEKELLAEPAYKVIKNDQEKIEVVVVPQVPVLGDTHPVGARSKLRGRENIIMTEWGPWDYEQPLVRRVKKSGGTAVYEILQVPVSDLRAEATGEGVQSELKTVSGKTGTSRLNLTATEPGLHPFTLRITTRGQTLAEIKDSLLLAQWRATFFKWPADLDPRKKLDEWRNLAAGPKSISVELAELTLHYGMRGPSELNLAPELSAAKLGQDHFGMIARTRLPLTSGTWQFSTLSDDGIRVSADGKPVIENWTWHGPTRDTGKLTLTSNKTVELVIEHFQIDGYAVLEFSLTKSE